MNGPLLAHSGGTDQRWKIAARALGHPRMSRARPHFGSWGTTTILSLCFVMSYVDRQILGLLVEPIKQTLHATDVQIGLLFGATFGVVFAIVGLPIGAAVDRWNRKWLVVCGITLWSLLTIGAGFASVLALLFVCRIGVALGEATLSPAATSIISDLFPPSRRSFPISVFFASGMVGAGGAFIVGAGVVAAMTALVASGWAPPSAQPWRMTLIAVGLPGLVLATVIAWRIREPARAEAKTDLATVGLREVVHTLVRQRWGIGAFFAAIAFSQLAPASIGAWVPSILHRQFGYTVAEAGLGLGVTQLLTAPTGQILIGAAASALYRRMQRGAAFVIVTAVSVAASTVAFAMLPLVRDGPSALVLLGVTMFFSLGITSIPPIAIGLLLENRMRGSSVAFYYMMIALMGVALGPVLIPWLATHLASGTDSLLHSMAIAGVTSGVIAILICFFAAFGLRNREVAIVEQRSDGRRNDKADL